VLSLLGLDAVHRTAGGDPGVVRGAGAELALVADHAGVAPDVPGTSSVPQQVRIVQFLPHEDEVRRRHELGDERAARGRTRKRIGANAVPARAVVVVVVLPELFFAEELGLLGVVLTLALFLGLIWRSFHISRLAADAGLKFPAYLAAGFGLWIGIQAFINVGVNMGVLPTKGLTLPLMSYGRSSLIVALAWTGLLLRVYHEAIAKQRGSATVRGAA